MPEEPVDLAGVPVARPASPSARYRFGWAAATPCPRSSATSAIRSPTHGSVAFSGA